MARADVPILAHEKSLLSDRIAADSCRSHGRLMKGRKWPNPAGRRFREIVRKNDGCKMSALRIYADFNGLVDGPKNPERTAVVLDTFGSLRDLANAGVTLREGLEIIAVDESDESEDLEGHGTAEFDKKNGWWVVEFDEQGVRHVPASDRIPVIEFRCVSCQTAIDDFIESNGLSHGDKCPNCGIGIHAPIAPPDV